MKQIFVHGLGQTSESWDKTIIHLNNKDHIVCPNLADLVQTGEVSYKRLYLAFAELCNKLGKPIALCGLSLGGVLALNYAIDYPDRVHSLVLIAPQYKMPKRLLRLQNIVFHFMPKSTFQSTGFKKADFIELCQSMIELDFSKSINEITCPVLVVYGEKDSANKKAAIELNDLLRNGTLKKISHSRHEVNIDAPDELAKLLHTFYDCMV